MNISLKEAKENKLFYFVINVLVHREDKRFLLLKRSDTEKAHPGKWATPGGKLEWEDLKEPTRMNGEIPDFENIVEDLARREVKEEAGVDIGSELTYINSIAFIRPDNVPVVLIKFSAPYLSGDVVMEEGAFTEAAWVNEEEVKNLDCIQGTDEEIAKATRQLWN